MPKQIKSVIQQPMDCDPTFLALTRAFPAGKKFSVHRAHEAVKAAGVSTSLTQIKVALGEITEILLDAVDCGALVKTSRTRFMFTD